MVKGTVPVVVPYITQLNKQIHTEHGRMQGPFQQFFFFFTFLNWENRTWYWGKKVAIFDWGWDRNSAPRDGQKRPWNDVEDK